MVANQQIIQICKRDSFNEQKVYGKIDIESLGIACQMLNDCGLKLWMYLDCNADGYQMELSAVDFLNWSGLSLSSYKRAKKELIDKGYLMEKSGNMMVFYERPMIGELVKSF